MYGRIEKWRGKIEIRITGIARKLLFTALLVVIMTGLARVSAMAAEEVTIQEGVYRIKAVDGNAQGKYLFYSEGSDRDKRLQFQSFQKYTDITSFRDGDMEQLWMIQRSSEYPNSYYIWAYYWYRYGISERYLVRVRKPNGDTSVYCESGADNGPDYYTSFKFYRESGSDNYNNLTIRPAGHEDYRLNRHKKVKVIGSDLIYVNANKDNDTANKLWQLEPLAEMEVRYWDQNRNWFCSDKILVDGRWNITSNIPPLGENEEFYGWYYDGQSTLYQPGQEMPGSTSGGDLYADVRKVTTVSAKTEAPSFTAKKNGKVAVNWARFRRKMKNTSFWKEAEYVEIEYSTDRNFQKNNGLKKIKKGSVNKIIAKTTLSKLEKNQTYYFRVRLWDGNGKCSKWSKTVRVRMKKS